MAISFIAVGQDSQFATSAVAAYTTSDPGPFLVVVNVRIDAQGRTVTVSDTAGGEYHLAKSQANGTAGVQEQYYAMNVPGLSNSVTVAISGAATVLQPIATAWLGLSATAALDQVNGGSGTGTAMSAGNVTTTTANQLVLAGFSNVTAGNTFTQGSGWTPMGDSGTENGEYQILSGTATLTAEATYGESVAWAAVVGTYSDTPISGSSDTPLTPTTASAALTGLDAVTVTNFILTPDAP
jgi:hypothetical protein